MKRLAFVLALVLALGVGFGCAKKATDSGPVDDSAARLSAEERAAAQQITDGRIFFAFNRFDLSPEARQILQQKADIMKRYPGFRVRIEGNCDDRGTQEYNLALGERRARAAYDFMTMSGVNPAQLEMVSFGKENPLVEGSGEAVWAQNRRDDFRVVSD